MVPLVRLYVGCMFVCVGLTKRPMCLQGHLTLCSNRCARSFLLPILELSIYRGDRFVSSSLVVLRLVLQLCGAWGHMRYAQRMKCNTLLTCERRGYTTLAMHHEAS